MNRLAAAALSIAALALAASAAGAAPQLPRLESCAGKPLLRPVGYVVLSCADGNAALEDTTWVQWGRHEAVGTTYFDINPCTPTCVSSKMRVVPDSTVRLIDPVATKRGLLFSRAVILYKLHGKGMTFDGYPRT